MTSDGGSPSSAGRLPTALGGVLVGLAAAVTWLVVGLTAGRIADERSDLEGMESLGFLVMTLLAVGVPAVGLVSWLLARMLRLPRPWAVALLGLAVTALLVCGLRAGGEKLLVWLPDWLEQAGVFVVAYLVAAVVVARLTGPIADGR
jgi:hypothetical protein